MADPREEARRDKLRELGSTYPNDAVDEIINLAEHLAASMGRTDYDASDLDNAETRYNLLHPRP